MCFHHVLCCRSVLFRLCFLCRLSQYFVCLQHVLQDLVFAWDSMRRLRFLSLSLPLSLAHVQRWPPNQWDTSVRRTGHGTAAVRARVPKPFTVPNTAQKLSNNAVFSSALLLRDLDPASIKGNGIWRLFLSAVSTLKAGFPSPRMEPLRVCTPPNLVLSLKRLLLETPSKLPAWEHFLDRTVIGVNLARCPASRCLRERCIETHSKIMSSPVRVVLQIRKRVAVSDHLTRQTCSS